MRGKAELTREQKRKVVEALKRAAGNMAEFWGESDYESELRDIPSQDGIAYLASLMRKLPGTFWDMRLGPPGESTDPSARTTADTSRIIAYMRSVPHVVAPLPEHAIRVNAGFADDPAWDAAWSLLRRSGAVVGRKAFRLKRRDA